MISRGALDPDTDPDLARYPVNLVDPGRIRQDPLYLDPDTAGSNVSGSGRIWARIR